MKTEYSPERVATFLSNVKNAKPDSITKLAEGHISQAFSFEADDSERFVIRISDKQADFNADKYASDNFGSTLLVPKVIEVGVFEPGSYYCVSELVPGKTSNLLTENEIRVALPSIQHSLAVMYHYDISNTTGYGQLDVGTGNATQQTWKAAVGNEIEAFGIESFRANATNIGLDPELMNAFYIQFRDNLQYASETRRLLHGDPAFDNMLIDNGEVTALIDWAQMAYGDWMSDFSRLDFWWPGRYGDAKTFAEKFGLEAEHIDERMALYWATNALWTIEFADKTKSKSVMDWLKEHIDQKLV